MLYNDGSVDLYFKKECQMILKKKQNTKNEMGRACGTNGREENCV